ncbi:transcription termination/antitermination protein NusG [Candidatus Entotheonella palauensis]|uniref:transcription termination/antitermination protein NusG n=1 Tax=Candidatus Entotheonella palauensis TaxID=93172 RepID=UPI000B7DB99B|nr:transcription termination/antitermination NusG family protein [Candidatus Entotheonella palauensis]
MDQNVPRYVQRTLDTLCDQHARTSCSPTPWFAVTTQAGQELSVRRQLAVQGILHLLPLWRPRRTWRDRLKRRLEPLFDGFIFVSCAPEMLQCVRHTQGVRRIVGDNDLPLPMDSEAMAVLQAMVAHRLSYRPHLLQYAGWKARVTEGVLAGAKGRFCIQNHPAHLVVNFELIQRAVAVDVPPETVEILWTMPEGRDVELTRPSYEIC